jgi:CTP synthase
VGKYTGLTDSYLSITKALFHAAIESDLKLRIEWIDSSRLEVGHQAKNAEEYTEAWESLRGAMGVLIPGILLCF